MRFGYKILFIFTGMLAGCIGTDVLDFEVMDSRVVITTPLESLAVGDSFALEAEYYDTLGMLVETSILWESSDPSVIQVDQDGVAEALEAGQVVITASAGEAQDTLHVVAGDETMEGENQRVASLQGLSSYRVSGTATLVVEENDALSLNFSNDFSSSDGPGLHVYLSNSGSSVSGGVDLGALQANSGAQSYAVPDDVSLVSYDFVLIYCKPFGVPFGNGQFEE